MSGDLNVQFTVACDHGIVVIEPLGSRADHDDWDSTAQPAHRQDEPLFVAVNPPMESAVAVLVRSSAEGGDHEGLSQVFSGRLEVASQTLLIGDSDANVEVRLPITSGGCHVSAWVDEPGFATKVVLLVDE
ncbi:hypothetical protein GCM10009623_00970 [Nocardioides aestuarii]|uniref:Uncharacterized protein n=1 Tax=Nocardioides aestuarii TaxID=252231 RepID=A0ABW4TLK3_9ACTN